MESLIVDDPTILSILLQLRTESRRLLEQISRPGFRKGRFGIQRGWLATKPLLEVLSRVKYSHRDHDAINSSIDGVESSVRKVYGAPLPVFFLETLDKVRKGSI